MSARAINLMLSGACAITLFAAAPAAAQAGEGAGPDPIVEAGLEPAPAADEEPWEFSVTTYAWLAGLKGDVGVLRNRPPVDVDLSFGKIFDHLKFVGTLALQAQKGRFVGLVDIMYVDLGADEGIGIRDPDFIQAELDTSSFAGTFAAGYRVVEGGTDVDLMAGARVSDSNNELTLTGPRRTITGDRGDTWIDPVVAGRVRAEVADNVVLALYGDVGGFGVSSDLTWQLSGTVQYDFARNWSVAAGWRHYAVDFEEDGFVYDVVQSGPIVGVTFRF